MLITIVGAGEIGSYIAEKISREGHDVAVIDKSPEKCEWVAGNLDVQVACGSASSVDILKSVNVHECDLFLSLSGSDEINLVSSSLAGRLGARKTIARVDSQVFHNTSPISYREHFKIDELFSSKLFASMDMASFIRNPGALAVEYFAQGAVEMHKVVVDRHGENTGKSLLELKLPKDVRIASITRDAKLIIPAANTKVQPGDTIILIGKTEKVSDIRKQFEGKKWKTQKVVILGGGSIARNLAGKLKDRNYRLTIIERSAERCRFLSQKFHSATVVQGDGTDLDLLEEERIENADIFVSTSAFDEVNIMSALQAKNLGVKKTMVLMHRPDYINLIEKIGIDHAVSPRAVMAREIIAMLKKSKTQSLADIGSGEAEILELHVENRKLSGIPLKDTKLPKNSLLLLLKRKTEVFIPNAATTFETGDVVLAICRSESRRKMARIFCG